jgi:hypothetical protein
LNAASLKRKQSRSKVKVDVQKVPISDEQISYMVEKIKQRQLQNQEIEQKSTDKSQTFADKLKKTKYIRRTKEYFKTCMGWRHQNSCIAKIVKRNGKSQHSLMNISGSFRRKQELVNKIAEYAPSSEYSNTEDMMKKSVRFGSAGKPVKNPFNNKMLDNQSIGSRTHMCINDAMETQK